jgi:hypothetical protein
MPRLDYRRRSPGPARATTSPDDILTAVMGVLLAEINTLRGELHLSPRTVAQLMETLADLHQIGVLSARGGGA